MITSYECLSIYLLIRLMHDYMRKRCLALLESSLSHQLPDSAISGAKSRRGTMDPSVNLIYRETIVKEAMQQVTRSPKNSKPSKTLAQSRTCLRASLYIIYIVRHQGLCAYLASLHVFSSAIQA